MIWRLLAIAILALSVGSSARAGIHGSNVAASPFVLNIVYESSALAAPQSFRDGVNAAAAILMAAIQDPITVNIQVAYGTSTDPAWFGVNLTGSGNSEGIDNSSTLLSYPNLRNPYQTHAASIGQSETTAVANNLTAGSATANGINSGHMSRAVMKVLGMSGVTARDASIDGLTIFGTAIDLGSLVGVTLHELTHAMGRSTASNNTAPFYFGRFKSPQVWDGDLAATSGASYLSIDGGATSLAVLATSGDTSDLSGAITDDVFNATYNPATPYTQNLSALDKKVLRMLGYTVN